MTTGFVWHEFYMWHETGNESGLLTPRAPVQPGNSFESAETKRRLRNLLEISGLLANLEPIEPRHATRGELLSVHDASYVDRIQQESDSGGGEAGRHAHFGPGGFEIAALAAGGVIAAVEAVLDTRVDNAYALVRPIGHHAERDFGRGFCIFNNGAVAGRHAMREHGLQRIAFVDWDVHHGNGTERIFYDDPSVLTISLHQDNWLPANSGHVASTGVGAGAGYNINIPLPPGSGVGAYCYAFERLVIPALERFRPELIIVPCGFDANAFDPMARMILHSDGFRALTQMMLDASASLCDGRLVLCQEGGYSESYVPFCGLAVLEALSGVRTDVVDPHLDLLANMAGQELAAHQRLRIDDIAPLIAHIS